MRRTTCAACEHDDLESFLDLGLSPIADAYTDSADDPAALHPLELAVCTNCWLVQLLEVVDHVTLFGTGYSFYSSASAPLSLYHEEYAADVLSKHRNLATMLTVEVGCNDGDLLRHFDMGGCRAVGVDPASGPVAAARDRDLNVIEEPFGLLVAEKLREDEGPAGVLIANHVLAHVESVADVLNGIQHLLAPNGVAYIEVQYLPDLLVNNAFDLAYHEHRNFFSLSSLESAVGMWGLKVVDAQLTDRQGGSLRVVVRHSGIVSPEVGRIRASEKWLRGLPAYTGFQGRAERVRERLLDLIAPHAPLVGYGAPAKATTLLHFCGLDSRTIPRILDTTPAKQGRFVPGTGIQIIPPEEVDLLHEDALLLFAWNYAPQIIRHHTDYLINGGRWIIPIPSPIIL